MADFPLEYRSRPPVAEADGPAPAVVLLHGRGADADDLLGLADDLPDALHVLSPQAPDPLGPGFTWYELDLSAGGLHESQPDPDDFRRSLDLLTEFREAAVTEYDLDPDRIGLFGFSQGAIASLASVLEAPDDWAWAAALHGYLPASHDPAEGADVADAAGFPVFVAGGEADDVIPLSRVQRAADRLRDAGLDVTAETYPTAHGIGPRELADVADWVAERVGGSEA
ncbi:MAG: alpha/beta hydrolase [Halobacteriaceae archaeon]